MAEQEYTLNGVNLNKLKVAELKKELKDRGLATTGNKTELVDRLMDSVRNNKHNITIESVDDIDEDDVLNDEEIEDEVEEDIKSVELEIYPPEKKASRTESCDSTDTSTAKTVKKVVLNRTPSSPEEFTPHISPESDTTNGNSEKKVIKLSQLSAQERLEMRAKKFGAPVSDEVRKLARAERFGAGVSSDKKTITFGNNGSLPTSTDVLQKRAARFGIKSSPVLTKAQKLDVLEKRKARFASSTTESKADTEQQKAIRLERFKK